MTDHMNGFWYLASYPKSGNTWCRAFISELLRLDRKLESNEDYQEFNLNRDIETGRIASSRLLIDDQLGVNSCDLSYAEIDLLRGAIGCRSWPYDEGKKFHKIHDAFYSPDSRGRPIANINDCHGAVYIIRHPEDVAVSLSHYFSWSLDRCVDYMLDPYSALMRSDWNGERQVRQFLARWDQHVLSWVDQPLIPILLVRYEDMLTNGMLTFQNIAEFLNLPSKPSLVHEAMERTSITRLKEMEDRIGGYKEKPKSCERFFRSGRSGEGAHTLTNRQREHLAIVFKTVMKKYGYEGPMQ